MYRNTISHVVFNLLIILNFLKYISITYQIIIIIIIIFNTLIATWRLSIRDSPPLQFKRNERELHKWEKKTQQEAFSLHFDITGEKPRPLLQRDHRNQGYSLRSLELNSVSFYIESGAGQNLRTSQRNPLHISDFWSELFNSDRLI